ncbi:MAG: DUF58 domain-containing protein [Planctomycetota bacterium]|nr:DUF58 domain-containing protein [Planctomycetota bacterium]
MTANPLFRWLKPTDIEKVSVLQMLARDAVEGATGGIHRSRHVGASVDFKEHRPYVHGDEIRSIDWKLFGKTDRLYIRQYEDETSVRAMLVVDQSGSMNYSGTRSKDLTKHDYAIRLACCLAYLLVSQQDSVGLVTFDTAIRKHIPPRSRPDHLRLLLESLASAECRGETELGPVMHQLLSLCRKRGIVMVLSDCFGNATELFRSLSMLRANNQEVLLFQIIDDDEVDFPFQNRTLFRSLELKEQQLLVDPVSLRQYYLRKFADHQESIQVGCKQNRIDWIPVRTSEPFSSVLATYIARRGQS